MKFYVGNYCRADALVYNADQHLEPQAFWKLIKEDASAPFQEVKKRKPLVYTDVNIGDLLNHIDIEFCDAYDTWLRIGAALFNSGFEKSVFDVFSERSHKYSYTANCDLWSQFEKKTLGCIQFASIMYLLKLREFKYFEETQAKLKTVNQVTEMDKFLQTGHINHSIVASIFYEGFNWKYQYSNGYWYRLSTGGIFQKLSKDAEVHIAKEMKQYLQGFLYDVIQATTDEDKRKKLWATQAMIESNSFKMGCVAEAKQDFMNENLYRDLDSKNHLVGFKNGVYDLEVMAFRTGTVEDKVSMTTRFDFDENYEQETFDFIDEMINGYFTSLQVETARWFKKHMGSLLGGGNKEEKGYFWVGNGRNGKGTLDNLLIKTLGDYHHKLPNEFFVCAKKNSGGAEPEILAMKNRRLCMTHEPEGSAKYLTSKFKTNTGNDPMYHTNKSSTRIHRCRSRPASPSSGHKFPLQILRY